MKKPVFLLIFLSLVHITLRAQNNVPFEQQQLVPSYNAPARIETQGSWDIMASASFLYWIPKEVGLDSGILVSLNDNLHPDKVLDFGLDFFPGFIVSLGTNFHMDNWSADIKYTRLHSTVKEKEFTANWAAGIVYKTPTEIEYYLNMKTRWRLELDLFDLNIGRPYYNGKNLVIKPNMSARGGWTKQSHVVNGSVANVLRQIRLKSKSWFLGPQISADINWLLTYHFKILANISSSVLYQKFDTDYLFTIYTTPETLWRNLHAKTGQITPNLDLKCGIGYSSFADNHTWHIDLLLTYDFMYFWNQNEFTAIQDFREYYNYHASGDLMLQGIELSLKINF